MELYYKQRLVSIYGNTFENDDTVKVVYNDVYDGISIVEGKLYFTNNRTIMVSTEDDNYGIHVSNIISMEHLQATNFQRYVYKELY